MAMRLTINVENIRRFIEINTDLARIIPEVIDEVADAAFEHNERLVPKKSGKLQESFGVQVEQFSLRCGWSAPHAKYVDKGTHQSPGRYVPAINKRLTMSTKALRVVAYRYARSQGIPHERAKNVLTVPIKERSYEKGPYAEFGFLGEYAEKENVVYIGKHVKGAERTRTIAHELHHAAQTFPKKATWESFGKTEEAARFASIVTVAVTEQSIGTHPGFQGKEFSKNMADALKVEMLEATKEAIRRRWQK